MVKCMCKYCGREFYAVRGRIYCGDICRKRRESELKKYKKIKEKQKLLSNDKNFQS